MKDRQKHKLGDAPMASPGHLGRLKHLLETLNIKTNNYVGKPEGEKEVKIHVPFKLLGMTDALEQTGKIDNLPAVGGKVFV